MLKIEHPSGVMPVFVQIDKEKTEKKPYPIYKVISFVGTSRSIMDGNVNIPQGK